LVELHDFVSAIRRELEETAWHQRILAHCLYGGLLLIAGWGGVLMLQGHGRFAQLLVTSAALTTSFLTLNWRPYALSRWRRRLAKQAAWMAQALSEQIRVLEANLSEPSRSSQEWSVVQEALSGRLAAPHSVTTPPRRSRRRPRLWIR
jgi:hypothetical protein